MTKTTFLPAIVCAALASPALAHEDNAHHGAPAIQQYGLPLTLMNTIYEGEITAREMQSLGDIGVGVSNHLDGELTAVDGVIYLIAADGTVSVAPDTLKAPYMSMIKFEPTDTVTITDVTSFADMQKKVLDLVESVNSFYAFKATGTFEYAKMASAYGVEDEDVDFFEYLGSRQMYEREEIEATIVGIYTPDYLGIISIPGLHLHFQSADNKLGGHLEDIRFTSMEFQMQELNKINLSLPNVEEFRTEPMQMIQPPSGAGAGGSEDKK